jgi:hypothetical protein
MMPGPTTASNNAKRTRKGLSLRQIPTEFTCLQTRYDLTALYLLKPRASAILFRMDSHLDNPTSHSAHDQDSQDDHCDIPSTGARTRINTHSAR